MAWIDELQSDGRVHWLQSFDKSRAMLAKLLSAIIFTGSFIPSLFLEALISRKT